MSRQGAEARDIVTDPTEVIGDRLFSLDVLVSVLHDVHNLPEAHVQQTGGGTATVYAGTYVMDDGDPRWPAAAGPGLFDWTEENHSTGSVAEFYVNPDDDGESDTFVDCAQLGPVTIHGLARVVAAQARRSYGDALPMEEARTLAPEPTEEQA